jgi:16S rRNA processing protein RimM
MLMDTPDLRGSGKRRVPEPRFLAIARVVKPWGVRGELKLEVLTGFPDQLGRLTRVYLGPEAAPHTVARFHWHSGELLVQLADVRDRNAAELLRDQLVQIAREDAIPLEPGQFYEYQIIGLNVITTDGEPLGQVVEVLSTGANDVYVVQGPRGEVLLPARAEVVRAIDLDAGTMTVTLLPGLLEG